jgi:CRP/FNR family transcriptional regulator, cyclic AMP receptor protein
MMESQLSGDAGILKFLYHLPLFKGVSQVGLERIVRESHLKQVLKGTYLFFQTDPGSVVYLVRRGMVAIRLENSDGRELVINEMGAGECFGELSIITGQPRSTSAEAISDCELLLIPRPTFQAVLEKEPSLALRLLKINAARLQNSSKREEALAFHDAQQRLARQLLHQDQLAADKGYLTLSQEELAQRAGLTRQTTALILGRWRRRGWLLTGRGHIVVLNRHELEKLDAQSETKS